jgi:hypothetical protein
MEIVEQYEFLTKPINRDGWRSTFMCSDADDAYFLERLGYVVERIA